MGNGLSTHAIEITRDGYNNRRYSNYEASVALEYKVPFIDGLNLKLLYNNYSRHNFTKHFTRPYPVYIFKLTGGHNHIMTNEVDRVTELNARDWIVEKYDTGNSYQLNGFISYDKIFGDHSVNALLVYEQAEGFSDYLEAQRNFYLSNTVDQMFAGSSDANDSSVTGTGSEDGRLSYAGRVHYGYADKYLLEASFRYDGSVRFAPKYRWGFFPSFSGAWRISEENFFKNNVRFIDYMKLKASVGLLGNDLVGGWQWTQRYTFTPGAQYGTTTPGIIADVTPNPYITWEKSWSYDGGLDVNFLRNRLTLELSAFYKYTYDILGNRLASMPSSFGGNMPAENYGEMDAKGFEIELGYRDKIGTDFDYYVKGNVGYAANKILKMDEAENIRPYQSQIGYSNDRHMGYVYTDIIRTQEELDALPENYTIFGVKPELGMMNYKDIRGATSDEPDGKIDDSDQDWIINHSSPPINYGFSFGGNYKNIALDVFFHGVAGGDLIVWGSSIYWGLWRDHWTPENIDAEFPKSARNGLQANSTLFKRNSSFLRLKDITLSYKLPKPVLSKLGISQFKIYATGTNLFLLEDHVKYFDPENGYTATSGSNMMMMYPQAKSYSVGINLSF
jgi:TonB-linked SusC/RagA family outer membrane protein